MIYHYTLTCEIAECMGSSDTCTTNFKTQVTFPTNQSEDAF